PRTVVTLIDIHDIGSDILANHVPGLATAVGAATDVQAGTLARRVEHRALVFAERVTVRVAQFPRVRRQVGRQERAEVALADEADAGGILFRGNRQARVVGDP